MPALIPSDFPRPRRRAWRGGAAGRRVASPRQEEAASGGCVWGRRFACGGAALPREVRVAGRAPDGPRRLEAEGAVRSEARGKLTATGAPARAPRTGTGSGGSGGTARDSPAGKGAARGRTRRRGLGTARQGAGHGRTPRNLNARTAPTGSNAFTHACLQEVRSAFAAASPFGAKVRAGDPSPACLQSVRVASEDWSSLKCPRNAVNSNRPFCPINSFGSCRPLASSEKKNRWLGVMPYEFPRV